MQFKDVVGQEQVIARLIRSVKEEKISHAQLFLGAEGVGTLPLALAYAQYICCENRGEDDSCGICPSCIKFSKLVHPDLHFVFPVVKLKSGSSTVVSDDFVVRWREAVIENPYLTESQWYEFVGAENKQGIISRDESKEVLKKLSLKPYESEFKVMILWMAEKMHVSAANALLKMIEEPPDKTIFLLLAANTDQILTTILSRTQMVRIGPVAPEAISKSLQDRVNGDMALLEDVVRRANGNVSNAIKALESDELDKQHFEEFVFLMRKCYGRDIIALHKWTEKIAGWGRERLKIFLAYSLRMIRENFMLNLQQEELTYLSKKEADFSQRFSPYINEGNVFQLASEFELAIDHIAANGYAKLVLLDLSVKTIMLLKTQ